MEVSLPGVGEAPISISSSPLEKKYLDFTIRACGRLTNAIHELRKGDKIYVRGPYGNPFLSDEVKGKNLYFVGGGIGLAPLRSLIHTVLGNREEYGEIKILYGAKTPGELCFREEFEGWRRNCEVLITVDKPDAKWDGNIGVVTELWDKTGIDGLNSVSFVCGPPVMMKFVILKLLESLFGEESIYLSLERYMKCGIGKCGHCNIAGKFVCIDGPVFSYKELEQIPENENAI
jgi:sulfhydrogenase subunit gamma (sulfur reductase)